MRVWRYVAIVGLLTAIGLVAVWWRAQAIRQGYVIARERARQRELLEERARLRFEVACQKTPERLVERGQALRLAPAPPDQPRDLTRVARNGAR